MNGKGDKPRPMFVSPQEFANNWDIIDWRKKPTEHEPVTFLKYICNKYNFNYDKRCENTSMSAERLSNAYESKLLDRECTKEQYPYKDWYIDEFFEYEEKTK